MSSQHKRTFIKTLPGLSWCNTTGVRRFESLLDGSVRVRLQRSVRGRRRFRRIRRRVALRRLLLLFLIWYLNINVGRRRRAISPLSAPVPAPTCGELKGAFDVGRCPV